MNKDREISDSFHSDSQSIKRVGTLAIDLGNSTTVVAFQSETGPIPELLKLGPISRKEGEVPSLIWLNNENNGNSLLIGQEVVHSKRKDENSPFLSSNFKRWIGSQTKDQLSQSKLSPEKAGELLLLGIWQRLPIDLKVNRLVLTAPVESYRAYRAWLNKVCSSLPVQEIALVDEPTAAAMEAGLPPGSKLLVMDIGGSTIDFSLVALEGGEGKAEPVAQLMRFAGTDLEGKSKQILRCAKVLGKSGIRLGGRDFDRWIANYLMPEMPLEEGLLNASEALKCRLSEENLQIDEYLFETIKESSLNTSSELALCKRDLEKLLIKNGLFEVLNKLLNETLAQARANNCNLIDLQGVVAVGGGAQIPSIRKWLSEKSKPIELLTPPPIEAVALGALRLTPGVKVKDLLHHGISLRCWDQKSKKHFWHPLFIAGQPWPTSRDLEITLSSSKSNQNEIELLIGEPELENLSEVTYVNGIPTIKTISQEALVREWETKPVSVELIPPGNQGEDCINLKFSINEESQLIVKGLDLRTGELLEQRSLGPVR